MTWVASLKTVGALALSTLRLFARLLYVLSTPLRWCLRYAYAVVLFLLSPVWAIFSLGLGAVSFTINLISKLKYLYIYLACATIIGICAGCMLHGTSSFIFVLLGMDTASERRKQREQSEREQQKLLYTSLSSRGEDEDEYFGRSTRAGTSWRRLEHKIWAAKVDPHELFEKRWKALRAPEQPRRRRKGLLAQTIHEESSESDL